MYIISRCLLGCNCKYNGGNNKNDDVIEFCKTRDYVTICPETDAGLTSPRAPAEIQMPCSGEFRVTDREGNDLTEQFMMGAEISLQAVMDKLKAIGKDAVIEGAILKANSPSCGSGIIYDGSFTGNKTPGDGMFTALLKKAFKNKAESVDDMRTDTVFSGDFMIIDEHSVSELVNK